MASTASNRKSAKNLWKVDLDEPSNIGRPGWVIWVPGLMETSGSVSFWWNEAVDATKATEVVKAVEVST